MGLCDEMKGFFLLSLLLFSSLFGINIRLYNDSAFLLNAEIYDNTGELLKTIRIDPGMTYIYDDDREYDNFAQNTNTPYTPYTIKWICQTQQPFDYSAPPPKGKKDQDKRDYETEYGSWDNVVRGAYVTAQGSPSGNKTCVLKKEKNKKPPRPYQPPSRSQQSDGFSNWSNDGGQTWSNDAGPPLDKKGEEKKAPYEDKEFLND